MKVLVTGANGFIGKALCAHLSALGHVTVPVVRRNVDIPDTWVANDERSWQMALEGCNVVVHLAARVHVMSETATEPLAEFRAANVEMTRKLASWAAGRGITRFVYMSSIKVNGEATETGHTFGADDLPAPVDAYAISKLEAEQALRTVCSESGMEFVVIRPPLVYGPGVRGNFLSMMRWVKRGIPLPLGAIANRRSLVALDNLVSFTMTCLENPAAANHVFAISDGEAVSTTEMLRKIARAYAVAPRLIAVPEGWLRYVAGICGKSSAVDRLLSSLEVSDAKARDMLDWRPVVTMDEQLRKMLLDDTCS